MGSGSVLAAVGIPSAFQSGKRKATALEFLGKPGALQEFKSKEAQRKNRKEAEALERNRILQAEEDAETARRRTTRAAVLSGGVEGILNPSPTVSRSRLLGN